MAEPASSDEPQVTYTAVLTPGEDGWTSAQVAEVPEAISQGRTLAEAKTNVTEALQLHSPGAARMVSSSPARAHVTVESVTVAAA